MNILDRNLCISSGYLRAPPVKTALHLPRQSASAPETWLRRQVRLTKNSPDWRSMRLPRASREQHFPLKGIDNAGESSSAKPTIERVAFKLIGVEAGRAGSTKRKSRLALRTFNFAIGRHANRTLRRESRHPAFSSAWSFLPSQAAFTNNKAVSRLLRRLHQISLWHQ
jgi:hypothetical protein